MVLVCSFVLKQYDMTFSLSLSLHIYIYDISHHVYLVAQSCLTLCNPMDYSLPGSSVHGISQTRILEWVAISFSWDLSDPGIEPESLVSPAFLGRFFTAEPPGKPI